MKLNRKIQPSLLKQHANWIKITNVKEKVTAKIKHVLRIDMNSNGKGFKGCHSKIALDDYVKNNPKARYELRNKVMDSSGNGVYEAEPIIKLENGTELRKTNNRGKSTFFPDDWDEARILEEVEHAINNNHGRVSDDILNKFFGYSKDNKVEIHFFYNEDGTISSYYPVMK